MDVKTKTFNYHFNYQTKFYCPICRFMEYIIISLTIKKVIEYVDCSYISTCIFFCWIVCDTYCRVIFVNLYRIKCFHATHVWSTCWGLVYICVWDFLSRVMMIINMIIRLSLSHCEQARVWIPGHFIFVACLHLVLGSIYGFFCNIKTKRAKRVPYHLYHHL